jgi:hypothetical protein
MGTLCANPFRVLFSSLQHYQVIDASVSLEKRFVNFFLKIMGDGTVSD